MKFLIAGLGNVGNEYTETRHNIGFKIAEALAEEAGASFVSGRLADVCDFKLKGKHIFLIKPTTFMNLSGKAVKYWMDAEKIQKENVLVIVDDLALPFGSIRLRHRGSDGGHNGLTSVHESLGTDEYSRLRFGIGNTFSKGKQVNYVLGKWNEEEMKTLPQHIKQCAEACKSFALQGIQKTMNQFNTK